MWVGWLTGNQILTFLSGRLKSCPLAFKSHLVTEELLQSLAVQTRGDSVQQSIWTHKKLNAKQLSLGLAWTPTIVLSILSGPMYDTWIYFFAKKESAELCCGLPPLPNINLNDLSGYFAQVCAWCIESPLSSTTVIQDLAETAFYYLLLVWFLEGRLQTQTRDVALRNIHAASFRKGGEVIRVPMLLYSYKCSLFCCCWTPKNKPKPQSGGGTAERMPQCFLNPCGSKTRTFWFCKESSSACWINHMD